MKTANLIFKDGRIVAVPVQTEGWPPHIDYHFMVQEHAYVLKAGELSTPPVKEQTIRVFYYGMQYGVAAYVEALPFFLQHRDAQP
jgi:hypothetical protein